MLPLKSTAFTYAIYYSIADNKGGVGILVALKSKYLKKFGLKVKRANITSVSTECQALSPDMPIIVLPSIIRE